MNTQSYIYFSDLLEEKELSLKLYYSANKNFLLKNESVVNSIFTVNSLAQ